MATKKDYRNIGNAMMANRRLSGTERLLIENGCLVVDKMEGMLIPVSQTPVTYETRRVTYHYRCNFFMIKCFLEILFKKGFALSYKFLKFALKRNKIFIL